MIIRTIVIPGKPVPLKRPRFTSKGKVYNSQSKHMNDISFLVAQQFKPIKTLIGPVQLNVKFFMAIPKSISKKQKEFLAGKYHYKKSDIDNNLKMILDVFTRAAVFKDDAQVAVINTEKIYSYDPRTEVTVIKLT